MEHPTIVKILTSYLQSGLPHSQGEVLLTPEYPLLESGLIDSLSLFKLVTFVEERFQVEVRPNEIMPDNFATLATVARLVQRKQQAQES